jgi:acyl carrier protein
MNIVTKEDKMIERIRQVFSEVTHISKDRLTLDSRLKEDLLLDSLTTLELILDLEGEFDIQIHTRELEKLKTFNDVVCTIESKSNS